MGIRVSMARGALRLGILLLLTMGLVLPALTPGAGAQATPVVEPAATVTPDPMAEPTTVPEPTVLVEPTDEPTMPPTTAPEATPGLTAPPAASAARSGIMAVEAADPYTVALAGPASVQPGDQLTYTLTFTNTSGRSLDHLALGGDLPADLSWSTVTDQTTASCAAYPTSPMTCTISNVADGATVTVTITAQVPDTVACDQAYATGLSAIGMYFTSPPDYLPVYFPEIHSNTVTTTVTCPPPSAYVARISGPATVHPGDQLTYSFRVTNFADQSIGIYYFGGELPAGLKWSFVEHQSFMPCQIRDQGGPRLHCISPDMPSLASSDVVLTARVPANVDCNHTYSTQVETFGIYSASPQVILPTVSSNTLTTEVDCPGSGIDIFTSSVYVAPSDDAPLGSIAWNLTVTNIGDADLTDVIVIDPVLTGLDCDPDTAGSQTAIGSLPEDADAVTCTATSPVTIAQGGTTVTTDASVRATSALGTDPVTDTGSAGVAVPDLSGGIVLEKTVDPAGPVAAGTTLTYTMTVTNSGNVTLDDVTVSDALPGLVWDAAHPDGAIGDLAPGTSATLTATYTVTGDDVTAGAITNEAIATGQHPTCRDQDDIPSIADCAIVSAPSSVTVETDATPVTPTPTAASTPATTPAVVTQLPTTGSGPGGSAFALALLAAAVLLTGLGLLSRLPRPHGN